MDYNNDLYRAEEYTLADRASSDARSEFIQQTYIHLLGAILAFITIAAFIQTLPIAAEFTNMVAGSRLGWFVVLAAFMGASTLTNHWARAGASRGIQYLGLGVYVLAEAVIFTPLLYMAANFGPHGVILSAGILTACVFTGLTSVVFFTRKNFAFLGPFLGVVTFAALGLIACSLIFGFNLGILFSAAMIVVAGGYIVYTTSNILHEYRTDEYVAASLALFASVALLFWYILRIMMAVSRR